MALDRITVDPNRMRGMPCIRPDQVGVWAMIVDAKGLHLILAEFD